MTGRQNRRPDAGVEIAAAPGDDPIVGKTKSQSAKGNFQARRRLVVADQKICHAHGMRIERAKVGVVLLSLDPAHDTPPVLREMAKQRKVDPAQWTLAASSDAYGSFSS